MVGVPDVEQGEKIGLRIHENPVLLPGLLFFFQRKLAGILNGKTRRDHQHLNQRPFFVRLQKHPGTGRFNRNFRHLPPTRREAVIVSNRAQLTKQPEPLLDRRNRRRVKKREVADTLHSRGIGITQLEVEHLQNHAREVGTQDFRFGVLPQLRESFLRIQPDAHARSDPSGASGALQGVALRDHLDGQALDALTRAVTTHALESGIDNIADARNRQGGFRNVGGDHHFTETVLAENAVLLRRREPSEERQDFHFTLAPAA